MRQEASSLEWISIYIPAVLLLGRLYTWREAAPLTQSHVDCHEAHDMAFFTASRAAALHVICHRLVMVLPGQSRHAPLAAPGLPFSPARRM